MLRGPLLTAPVGASVVEWAASFPCPTGLAIYEAVKLASVATFAMVICGRIGYPPVGVVAKAVINAPRGGQEPPVRILGAHRERAIMRRQAMRSFVGLKLHPNRHSMRRVMHGDDRRTATDRRPTGFHA